jgi:hypothetical protein
VAVVVLQCPPLDIKKKEYTYYLKYDGMSTIIIFYKSLANHSSSMPMLTVITLQRENINISDKIKWSSMIFSGQRSTVHMH